MGFKIGLPSLKLNNAGVRTRNCGDFGAVAREALKEREGHDPDIDPERAALNQYVGYQTAAELQEYSRKHVEQLRDAKGRRLRSDAVVMCVTLIKPPAAYMAKLSPDQQKKFLNDGYEILAEIIGKENIKSRADHYDEQGPHLHVFWEPITPDGRLCAKEMHNLVFFGRVNKEMPEKLRERGWDLIEDCEMYDAAKEQYEQIQKKNQNGRSSMKFKADAERAKEQLEREISEMSERMEDLQEQSDKIQAESAQLQQQLRERQDQLQEQQRILRETDQKQRKAAALYDEYARINEANLGVIDRNRALMQRQETLIKQNDETLVAQEDALDLIVNYEEYLDEGDELDQNLDLIENAAQTIPGSTRLFRGGEISSWMRQVEDLLLRLRTIVDGGIRRLQIYENTNQIEAERRISEPLLKRAASLDDQIRGAERIGEEQRSAPAPRRTGREDADVWRKRIWTIHHESKEVKAAWYADKEARQKARQAAWERKAAAREWYYEIKPQWHKGIDGKWRKIESRYSDEAIEDARRAYMEAKEQYSQHVSAARLPAVAAKTLEKHKGLALALADDPDADPDQIERAIERYRKAVRMLQEPSYEKIKQLDREFSDFEKSVRHRTEVRQKHNVPR